MMFSFSPKRAKLFSTYNASSSLIEKTVRQTYFKSWPTAEKIIDDLKTEKQMIKCEIG